MTKLRTERLLLRPPAPSDWRVLDRLVQPNDPIPASGRHGLFREWVLSLREEGQRDVLAFAIIERGSLRCSGLLIFGRCAVADFASISVALVREARGKGIATEALTGAISYVTEKAIFSHLIAEIEVRNLPSRNLFSSVGFVNASSSTHRASFSPHEQAHFFYKGVAQVNVLGQVGNIA